MRSLLIAVGGIAIAGAAAAGITENEREICKSISGAAGHIMTSRQQGRPMAEVMDLVAKATKGDALSQRLVIDAYERPRMSVPKNQQTMISDFKSEVYLACIKAKSD